MVKGKYIFSGMKLLSVWLYSLNNTFYYINERTLVLNPL
jgi:hypothetical protein